MNGTFPRREILTRLLIKIYDHSGFRDRKMLLRRMLNLFYILLLFCAVVSCFNRRKLYETIIREKNRNFNTWDPSVWRPYWNRREQITCEIARSFRFERKFRSVRILENNALKFQVAVWLHVFYIYLEHKTLRHLKTVETEPFTDFF